MASKGEPAELASLRAGQLFTRYVDDSALTPGAAPGSKGHKEEVMVWYESSGASGAFFWAERSQGKAGRNEQQQIQLKFLTDVFGTWARSCMHARRPRTLNGT